MDHAAPIYAVWRSAKELNVLDMAVMRAIKEQEYDDRNNDDSDANPSGTLATV